MSEEPICTTDPETGKKVCIPHLVLYHPHFPWEEWWPQRLASRFRLAWIALVRPPPRPWRALDVAVSAATRRDLTILSTLDSLAGALSPALRGDMRAALREHGGRVRLSRGAGARPA
jgi:hypothetical protein